MGSKPSRLENDFPADERFVGLINLGNTSWCTTVLHALYFCKPFRQEVLQYKATKKEHEKHLLASLADLFHKMATQKKNVGSLAPKKFIATLKKERPEYDNDFQQSAHEFLNFVFNRINELVIATNETNPTWICDIFRGTLKMETKCLTCDTVYGRPEEFLDPIPLNIDNFNHLEECLNDFSKIEELRGDNKFRCDICIEYQEAVKRLRIKELPLILTFELKRWKWVDNYSRQVKLSHRIVFPFHLKVGNMSDDAVNPDRVYELFAVIVHLGNQDGGHFITLVKTRGLWFIFDDDKVEKIDESRVQDFYGVECDMQSSSWTATAHILFYQASDYQENI